MNEMDIDESYLNEIDNEVKVEISSDNDMQIMCEECSEVIEDNDKLKKHMKEKHEKHICIVCGYVVYGRKKLYEHNRKHNQATCHICQKTMQKKNLQNHIEKCRATLHYSEKSGRTKHICNICGHAAQTEKKLEAHKKSKHEKTNN